MLSPDDVIKAARLVQVHARKLADRLPANMNAEDLESAGNVALAEAARTFDPELGFAFTSYAARAIRNAMLGELKKQRRTNSRRAPLETQAPNGDGRASLPPDAKANDPAKIAETREMIRAGRTRNSVVLTQIKASSPEVAEVAARAQELRLSAFAAVSNKDMTEIMKVLVANAKAGHVSSARLVLDYVGNGRANRPAMQQAVILPPIQMDDVD